MGLRTRLIAVVGGSALTIATVLVGYFEGRSLIAYLDPVGIPTICDGWTRGVQMEDRATEAQCDDLTRQALGDAQEIFNRWVPEHVRSSMPPGSTAAFLSFIYNVGPGKPGVKDGFVWLKSGRHSSMLKYLQAGNVGDACNQLRYWVSAQGKRLRGLERRREAERELCEEGL